MFIMVAGFVGGMQIATDSTAGERERGSLEPLLVNPAPRVAFVAGKWMAATLAAIVSVCLTTVLCAQITRLLSLEDMGIRLEIGPQHVGPILLAVGPMCLFTAALQAAVATLARSFKEAQTYMGVLILGPMLPGIIVCAVSDRQARMELRHPHARALRSSHRRPWRTRPRLDGVSHVGRYLPAGQRDPHSDHDRAVQERAHHLWTMSPGRPAALDPGCSPYPLRPIPRATAGDQIRW